VLLGLCCWVCAVGVVLFLELVACLRLQIPFHSSCTQRRTMWQSVCP
jgi:hypothetical protein